MTLTTRTLAALASALLALPAVRARAEAIKLEAPILLTSAGQSADVTIASMLFKKANREARVLPAAKASDLEGTRTLAVVAGFSSKGLGSAGINREQEMERVKALLAAAREKGVKVLVLHIGGKARRGAQSDEFNGTAAGAAHALVVVRTGDEDQFFTKLAAERKIPIDLVDKISDAVPLLARMFP